MFYSYHINTKFKNILFLQIPEDKNTKVIESIINVNYVINIIKNITYSNLSLLSLNTYIDSDFYF